MKKVIAGLLVVVVVVVAILLISGGGGSSEGYVVRAVFDQGSFMVSGEQVRVAGANVGQIKSVGVSLPGEPTAEKDGKFVDVPGKAIIELEIADPSFQDFRQDARCEIRPQSLIGEKYVDCLPTLPRAPGQKPAPELRQIPAGEPGAGQYLLPLGSSGTSVDPDLINDIQSLPYAQRFRLIFNELGAGLAGRGEDLQVAIEKANPTLRDVDKIFGELTEQKNQLAQLAADSQEILEPLSREKAARGRLPRPLGRSRRSKLRTRLRTGSGAAEVPQVPGRVPPDDEQPEGILRRRHAGAQRARCRRPVADRRNPHPDPVLGSDDGRAEEPRRRRRKVGADLRRSRTGGPQGGEAGDDRRSADRRTGPPLRQPEEDGRLGRPHRTDLQHRGRAQRLRQIRPLRPHPGHPHDLSQIQSERCRLQRLRGPLQRAPVEPERRCRNELPRADQAAQRRMEEGWRRRGESSSGAATGLGKGESAEGTAPAERRRAKAGSEPALGEAASTEAGTEPLLGYLLGQGE